MELPPLKKATLPKAPPLLTLLGPSFILLGLGLGSGEIILWPYLSSHYGLGIIWAAVIGITFQFFINMEISRYTLATGESVFAGLTRKLGMVSPIWFIFSTLLPWMWPGIIASSGTVLASLLGIPYSPAIPITLLLFVGVIYTLGPVIYKTQETLQKMVILFGVPFIFGIALFFAKDIHWAALGRGLIGEGDNYWFIPEGISIATFLAAFAYAGAGGNLNLGQSLYLKEKGYGMGAYSGKITNIFAKTADNQTLGGTTYVNSVKNTKLFKEWFFKSNVEHGVVFWATGTITILLLSLLAFTTVFGQNLSSGIQFVINEATAISRMGGGLLGTLFLLTAGVMLFFTQFSILGTTSRICTENLLLSSSAFKVKSSSLFFFIFLWLQILLGIIIFLLGFSEPLTLVVLGATLNAFSMFIYTGLVLWLNKTALYKEIRPGVVRVFMLSIAFLFYGGFTLFTIFDRIF